MSDSNKDKKRVHRKVLKKGRTSDHESIKILNKDSLFEDIFKKRAQKKEKQKITKLQQKIEKQFYDDLQKHESSLKTKVALNDIKEGSALQKTSGGEKGGHQKD